MRIDCIYYVHNKTLWLKIVHMSNSVRKYQLLLKRELHHNQLVCIVLEGAIHITRAAKQSSVLPSCATHKLL